MNVTAGNLLKDLKNRLRMIEQGHMSPSEEIVRYTKHTIQILETINPSDMLTLRTQMNVTTHHRWVHTPSGSTVGELHQRITR